MADNNVHDPVRALLDEVALVADQEPFIELWEHDRDAVVAIMREMRDVLKRSRVLLGTVTVRQIIEAGDDAIEAAGLNPWCINEGRASGDERFDSWRISHVLNLTEALETENHEG